MANNKHLKGGAVDEIANWLSELGLSEYAQSFADNGIDFSVLRDLTDQDLRELGILLGHRRKMLRAITELNRVTPTVRDVDSAPLDGAERRQLTIMFCDLVGSTALSSRLDPEDMREVIRAYQNACARAISTYDGFLAKYMGDGVLAYFGYPRAHEDDAERAVRAGLDMVASIGQLETRVNVLLKARVGIATGVVVVGDLVGEGVAQELAVVGDTPNLAARLQALAEPGTIVVSASTRRLLGDLFQLRDLGGFEVKGLSDPATAWAIEGALVPESRFEAVRPTRLSGFVGRETEIDLLLNRQRQAWQGKGQVVLVSGEAGIGKSRVAATFEERIMDRSHIRLRYQCSPYHRDSALHPFIGQLERAAGFKPQDPAEGRLEKLEAVIAMATPQVATVVPLIAALLSVPTGVRYPPLAMSPAQQRRQTLAALLDQLEGLARRQPVLLVFEDAHWADPTSIELLDLAIERVRQLPVLAVITFRPEFEPPWAGLPGVATLAVGRLDRPHVHAMIEQMTGHLRLPAEVMEQIIAKTDGIPLFVEELTKTVLESELLVEDVEDYRLDGPLPPLAIPATLQDSLIARLDRLAPVKEIAQIGAAIGREFAYGLLSTVAGRDAAALEAALVQLEGAELITRRGALPEAVYVFKHALVQDAAYASLLKSRRQVLHRRIAEALRDRFPTLAETEPEVVAHHFTEAGLKEPAVEWWRKAGERARVRSAFMEAIAHFRKAIDLAEELVDGPSQRLAQLQLQIAYANAQLHARGPGASEPTAAFARAREIAARVENASERFSAYYGLFISHYLRGEIASARETAEAMLRDVERVPGSAETCIAHRVFGMTCHVEGDYVHGRAHLERALTSYDPDHDRGVVWFGVDTGVATKCMLALVVWPLGDIDYSRRQAEDAVAHAIRIGHVPTMAFAHSIISVAEAMSRDAARALRRADDALGLAREHGMPLYIAIGTFFHGWGRWHSGDGEAGLTEMRDGSALLRGQGCNLLTLLALGLLAEAEATAGRTEDGLALIDNVLADISRTGMHVWDPEIYRLRGEILGHCNLPSLAESEEAFDLALVSARCQKTRTFELRAALSQANLYLATGREGEVQNLLKPALVGFDEDLKLPEVVIANRLLNSHKAT
jgi:class 3 adenylate cyclase/predicted ATPase